MTVFGSIPLTSILRSGARKLLAEAIEQEAEAGMKELKLADGRDRVVRHGHGSTRTIQTGVFAVDVALGKIRDRGIAGRPATASGSGQLGDSAAVGAPDEKPGRTAAGALTAGHFDRLLPGGVGGPAG